MQKRLTETNFHMLISRTNHKGHQMKDLLTLFPFVEAERR
jgi:hypothetical protein